MNRLHIAALILASFGFAGFMIPAASADIYSWTDENGVRHFTNQSPPKHAELLIKSPEISHDEKAHERRLEEDRLELARQELAEREALLLQQQLEAERRLIAANARAEAALQRAGQILQEAEAAAEANDNDRWSSVGFYYPYYRIDHRKYNRHSAIHGLYKKYHSIKNYHKPLYRSHSVRSHYSLTQGRYPSHHARSAAFRGRHGRF